MLTSRRFLARLKGRFVYESRSPRGEAFFEMR